VGARAPFDRGRLAAMEVLSKSAKELLCGSRLRSMESEGSMPPSEGIPPSTSPLASNMFEGISRKWLKPWPCTSPPLVIPNSVYLRAAVEPWSSPPLVIPNSVYSRAAVEPWSRASFRTLKIQSGLRARGSFTWKSPPVSILSHLLGCVFLGGKWNDVVVGDAANG
jgi:hypothetical protein